MLDEKNKIKIPFNKPGSTGKEIENIKDAIKQNHLSGDGLFTKKCAEWFEKNFKSKKAFLTHSCTGALEMAALLCDIEPGDEVIMPSFTFVSTANAFVLQGAIPVFVDIRPDTLNIDEGLIQAALTKKTKAIVPVHYAGVGCEMDTIKEIAQNKNIILVEDAAQAILSKYNNKYLATFGELACISFHETKNISSGEGGVLLINDESFIKRAEILWQKGTNRKQFLSGETDKYTWLDIGSSFLPGEMMAAYLYAQLEEAKNVNEKRLRLWNGYHEAFADLEKKGFIQRPVVPKKCIHNAHIYYIILNSFEAKQKLACYLSERGISAVSHYVPLHNSPYGLKKSRISGKMIHTNDMSERILRLPLWAELGDDIYYIIDSVNCFFKNLAT